MVFLMAGHASSRFALGSSSQLEEDAAQPSVLAAPASSDGMHDVDSDGDRCVGGDRRYDAEEGSLDGE